METYIKASALEERLNQCRHTMCEDDDDSWATAARHNGYDTAVDAATCYRERGGDIWHSLLDEPEDEPILLAVKDETTPVPGYVCQHVFYRADTNMVAAAYAWAYMPELPDPSDPIC